jgi:hypothetical protein
MSTENNVCKVLAVASKFRAKVVTLHVAVTDGATHSAIILATFFLKKCSRGRVAVMHLKLEPSIREAKQATPGHRVGATRPTMGIMMGVMSVSTGRWPTLSQPHGASSVRQPEPCQSCPRSCWSSSSPQAYGGPRVRTAAHAAAAAMPPAAPLLDAGCGDGEIYIIITCNTCCCSSAQSSPPLRAPPRHATGAPPASTARRSPPRPAVAHAPRKPPPAS